LHFFIDWFNRMLSINSPLPFGCEGKAQYGDDGRLWPWNEPFQAFYAVLSVVSQLFRTLWMQLAMVNQSPSHNYFPLEVLPDYYLNYDNAKRLWQDWRILRRLFVRRDHSRDLLLQGQSGWLPIHGMLVHQQLLTITTDEGEMVLALDEPVVWLSRANPANTQITRESVWEERQWKNSLWCPA